MTPDPYDAWEPWRPEVIQGSGPETVLCEDPPESMPTSRPAGFTAAVPQPRRRRRLF